jgi:hypothetical protein
MYDYVSEHQDNVDTFKEEKEEEEEEEKEEEEKEEEDEQMYDYVSEHQDNVDTFKVNKHFLEVLNSINVIDVNQEAFTYFEITSAVSNYIMHKKDLLFDKRNMRIALVKNDPLGTIFGVEAFHRCQINQLIKRQMKKIVNYK